MSYFFWRKYFWYIKSVIFSGVNSKLLILMSIIPNMFIYPYGIFNTSHLPKDSPSLPRILRVKNPPPPNPPSLKSSQGTVFSDVHFNTPYPISPGGGLFCHRNKQHSFKSKVLNNCHPIIVKPLTIRIPQAYIIPHLYTSKWGTFYTNQRHIPRDCTWS